LWIDEARLLSWGADWHLRLWDAATAAELAAFHDPGRMQSGDGGIRGVVRLADGRPVSWGYDGVVNLWDLDRRDPVARVVTGSDAITGIVIVDDRRFVSWSGSGAVDLWTVEKSLSRRTLRWHATYEGARSLVPHFILNGAVGLVGWRFSELSTVPLAPDRAPTTTEPFRTASADDDDDDDDPADITTVIRLPSGNVVAFSHGGRVCELSAADLTLVREYQALPTAGRGAISLTDGRFAAWYAGRLAVYRAGTAEPVFLLDSGDDIVVAAVAVPAGGLVYRTLRRELVGWNGNELWRAPMPTGREVVALRAIGDCDVAAWSFSDGGVAIAGPGRAGALVTDGNGIDAVAAHPSWPNTTLLAAAMADGDLCVGDVVPATTAVSPSTLHGAIRRVATDGTLVVASSEAGPVTLHESAGWPSAAGARRHRRRRLRRDRWSAASG
jgi:WD40 repeat protein